MIKSEQELNENFKSLIEEIGIALYHHGYQHMIYDIQEACLIDEVAVREWFNDWIDSLFSDGQLDADGYNSWTLNC